MGLPDPFDLVLAKLTPIIASTIKAEIPRVVEQMLRDGVTVTVNGIVVTVKSGPTAFASQAAIHGA